MNFIGVGLKEKKIILLGAGQLGRMTVDMWPDQLPAPHLILDSSASGSYQGVPIDAFDRHSPDPDSFIYILCYFKDSAKNIVNLFDNLFGQPIYISYDILTGFRPLEFSNGWVPTFSRSQFEQLLPMLVDIRSRNVLENALLWKFDRKLDSDFSLSPEDQKYDLAKYGRGGFTYNAVLDFGSYDGSLFNFLANCNVTWNSAHLFEPDQGSFRRLIAMHGGRFAKPPFSIHSKAVWGKSGRLPFNSSDLLSSRVTNKVTSSSVEVEALSLKDSIDFVGVNFELPALIKLHVEGAEFPTISAALASGVDLASADLLINLSHDEDSLLKLPRLIYAKGDHDLFLDSHSHFAEGLTLFARAKRWTR